MDSKFCEFGQTEPWTARSVRVEHGRESRTVPKFTKLTVLIPLGECNMRTINP